jgi:hypothetical protein
MLTISRNTDALLGSSKDSGIAGNAERTIHTVIFREQGAGQHHVTKSANESLDNEAKLKYFGVALIEFHAGRN